MNFARAKQIPICDYLSGKGIYPVSVRGNVCWYCSPLRQERTPSFKVDTGRNTWYDHGAGCGGNLIDLVQAVEGLPTAIDALHTLSGWTAPPPSAEARRTQPDLSTPGASTPGAIMVQSVAPLTSPALLAYLADRAIPAHLARLYLQQCHYTNGGKSYYALGFRNDLGGYELRNRYWKGATSPKGITSRLTADRGTVSVFEGFTDFLSALAYFNKTEPAHSWVVLNSVAMLNTALPALSQYERVNVFLDNDKAGQATIDTLTSACRSVVNCSALYYPQHKDFNDFVTAHLAGQQTNSLSWGKEKRA